LSTATPAPPAEVREALDAAYVQLFAELQKADPAAFRIEETAGVRCSRATGIDEPGWSFYLNQASGLGVRQPATEQAVDEVLSVYRPGRVPFIVAADPDARPRALAGWLEARGLRRRLAIARSQRGPGAAGPIAAGLRATAIGPDRAGTYASLAAHGLPAAVAQAAAALAGRPGWHHALAYDGETAIAGGALFVTGGIACLAWSATHPAHRRRGAHAALVVHRLGMAADMGCKVVVAETLETSSNRPGAALRNLVRAGFQMTQQVRVYVG
jgi:GNAT superfamily N-acetyltransferase